MNGKHVDVTIIVTFHNEGLLAQQTLRSIDLMRCALDRTGQTSDLICVCDDVDIETERIVQNFFGLRRRDQVIKCNYRDPGAARNSGIAQARSEFVTILDGDDLYSSNWLTSALEHAARTPDVIVHPEMVISFGAEHAYAWQVDQDGPYFKRDGLLVANYWAQWFLTKTEIIQRIRYPEYGRDGSHFAFEDWWWNSETVAQGFKHKLAWGTVGFYRRKTDGRLSSDKSASVTFSATSLFD